MFQTGSDVTRLPAMALPTDALSEMKSNNIDVRLDTGWRVIRITMRDGAQQKKIETYQGVYRIYLAAFLILLGARSCWTMVFCEYETKGVVRITSKERYKSWRSVDGATT